LGSERKDDANYLDACRSKRNIVEYDYIGGVTENDANELIDFVKDLKHEVERWLEREHPEPSALRPSLWDEAYLTGARDKRSF